MRKSTTTKASEGEIQCIALIPLPMVNFNRGLGYRNYSTYSTVAGIKYNNQVAYSFSAKKYDISCTMYIQNQAMLNHVY